MKYKLTIALALIFQISTAQDVKFARKMIDTLTSTHFWGRGYTHHGMAKTSKFLANQFQKYGLTPMNGKSYYQDFLYPVNTFPGKMEVAINGLQLVPGVDFIVSPDSRGISVNDLLVLQDSNHFTNENKHIMVTLENKLTWSVATRVADYTSIQIDKKALKQPPKSIKATIENKLIPNFKAANVCGFVKGTIKPDSLLIITAHYDHLGGMGNATYFPGANDNASGISLLLDLAKYYSSHPQPYTIAFICFAGEEAGLLGSKYFTEHPLIDMKNIRFLVNVDLVGTGDEGITVVNATTYKQEFALLNQINKQNNYLVKINLRGKAANSDHYWFTEKGVPAFFIYTLGGIKAYHDVFDRAKTLPLNEFEDLFKLLVKFNEELIRR